VPSVFLEADSGREVLHAFLSDAPREDEWRGDGNLRVLVQPDGRVTGVSIRGYLRWANNRMVLADLIARSLRTHRDEVVDALLRVQF
jgi:hypothetical protein